MSFNVYLTYLTAVAKVTKIYLNFRVQMSLNVKLKSSPRVRTSIFSVWLNHNIVGVMTY